MNFGFSGELIFLALLGLILFGPRKLPEIARKAGRFVDDLKRASNEFQGHLNREIENLGPADAKTNDPTKNLLDSLMEDFRGLGSTLQPAKPGMSVPEPTQPKQEVTETLLFDNVSRIKDLLAEDGTATETQDREQPPQPAELAHAELNRDSASTSAVPARAVD